VTPAAREPACILAHDGILKRAMNGALQDCLDAGVASAIQTGFLFENTGTKRARDKGVRDPESYTRLRQRAGETTSKDRSRADAMRRALPVRSPALRRCIK
jgi:hypothetical protein